MASIKKEISDLFINALKSGFGYEPAFGVRVDPVPNISFGDFTMACFPFTKDLNKKPDEIAKVLAGLVSSEDFESLEAVGAYVNIKVKNEVLFESLLNEVLGLGHDYGHSSAGQGKRVMVEYLSPNTNKPLHLGHVRNGALGMAVSNLLEATGHAVVKANLINDRGVHICKSMLAYQKWGQGRTPETEGLKGDHFVGEMYVLYSKKEEEDPLLGEQIQEMLRLWEAQDPIIMELWNKMNGWVYDGFARTYEILGLEFDVFYYESKTYTLGKDIVLKGLKNGALQKLEGGAVVATLPIDELVKDKHGESKKKILFGTDKNGEPKKTTLLRDDGTSVYMTQDIGTAVLKFEEHGLNRSIYVVGSEQIYHFKSLFAILDMLGYPWAKDCFHLSYGMVYLPEGKMKSREGKVVDADDLIEGMQRLAEEEIKKRDTDKLLSEDEIKTRALKIGAGAIKFYLLRVSANQDIHFDPKESISFDGMTGPYCQYTYARSCSILRRAKSMGIDWTKSADLSGLGNNEERQLLQRIMILPDVINSASVLLQPSLVCNHLYETAQAFNMFYQKHKVIAQDENEGLTRARLKLVEAVCLVLKKGLELMGIAPIEEM